MIIIYCALSVRCLPYTLWLFQISFYIHCGVVSLFIFLEKTKQKIVTALESLCFQGRSP